MRKIILILSMLSISYYSYSQYDNSEKLSILAGFVSTGSEYIFWSDNVYGGNLQIVYDFKKIHEGAIGFKASTTLASGFQGYYGGLNFRMGARFFMDMDLLFGYTSITNGKLLDSYGANINSYSGSSFVGNIGIGYRFESSPLFIRLAYGGHFPINHMGLNTSFAFQLGFRIK